MNFANPTASFSLTTIFSSDTQLVPFLHYRILVTPERNSVKSSCDYELIDFGSGEKLERLGSLVVRRDTPSAEGDKRLPRDVWESADLQFCRDENGGRWKSLCSRDNWSQSVAGLEFCLRTVPSGQVGLFPEQALNWNWVQNAPFSLAGMRALNLFAYTGGTTMALAKQGVEVSHVDSAKSVVNWARQNAKTNGLADAPIRWIVEDAVRFVEREINRDRYYDIVVADPPSFGRGLGGTKWKIQRDLDSLIAQLSILTGNRPKMLLLSCHTPGLNNNKLLSLLKKYFGPKQRTESFPLWLSTNQGTRLASGDCVRWFDASAAN